jgi:phage regulator Rha-like protein
MGAEKFDKQHKNVLRDINGLLLSSDLSSPRTTTGTAADTGGTGPGASAAGG